MAIRQRALSAILKDALLSPLSLIVAGTGVALVGLNVNVPLLNSPAITWLIGIVPLWLGVVGARLLNRDANAHAIANMLREDYNPSELKSAQLQSVVKQALAYRERIDETVRKSPDTAMKVKLADVANQVEDWIGRIYALAKRLDAYYMNKPIRDDLYRVPEAINELNMRLHREPNPAVRQELEQTIAQRQTQLKALENLDDNMERAELQLESNLTALGTVYSQMLLIDTRDIDSGKAQRMRESVSEQINSLNDVLSSIEEINATPQQTMAGRS